MKLLMTYTAGKNMFRLSIKTEAKLTGFYGVNYA